MATSLPVRGGAFKDKPREARWPLKGPSLSAPPRTGLAIARSGRRNGHLSVEPRNACSVQAGTVLHSVSSRSIAFIILIILCITATTATLGFLPAASSLSFKVFSTGLC